MNGSINPNIASINADLLDFLISLNFSSRPAMKIKKNTATLARIVIESLGSRIAKSEGPKITPASNSPTNEGCLILRNNSPNTFANASESTIISNKCSICNNIVL